MKAKKEYIPVITKCCLCNKDKEGLFYNLGYVDGSYQYGCTRCLKNDHQAESYMDMLERIKENGTINT